MIVVFPGATEVSKMGNIPTYCNSTLIHIDEVVVVVLVVVKVVMALVVVAIMVNAAQSPSSSPPPVRLHE